MLMIIIGVRSHLDIEMVDWLYLLVEGILDNGCLRYSAPVSEGLYHVVIHIALKIATF